MKIGIITHYHNSVNYGGNLQAYALCRVLNDSGYHAEQIVYDKKDDVLLPGTRKTGLSKIVRGLAGRAKRVIGIWKLRKLQPALQSRNMAIRRFNENAIPHSAVCYQKDSITKANGEYDVFITGSDQVWHPKAVCGAYLLDFAHDEKTKLSYAASISADRLPAELQERYRECLASYDAVSVRERDAVEILSPLTPVQVQWVLDPTLLLDRQQWDGICTEKAVEEPYLFCYFLGDASADRRLATEYARHHGLKIVTLPHLNGAFHRSDVGFGDRVLYGVSPNEFISLIKYADCVMTDSFHATVFSMIYERNFFVFQRSGHGAMSTRIHSLTGLIGAEAHFCATQEQANLDYLESVPPVDYHREHTKLEEMKRNSRNFLFETIKKAEKKIQNHES